jgi:effector-binding domain-containing protein
MNTEIDQYIKSGILEAFVTGATTPAEEREVLQLKARYPEVNEALKSLELDMEDFARTIAITPPPRVWDKIEAEIDDIIAREKTEPRPFTERESQNYTQPKTGPQYIDVEVSSSHMKVHKAWKYVLAFIFVMGKIFLGAAIYFYLENRQAQEQIKELKTEIQALK